MALYQGVVERFDRYMEGADEAWFAKQAPPAGESDRLLLHGVRPPPVAGALLGGPRRPRRRLPEERQRSRAAARRGRACSTSNGYFRQTIDADGRQQHLYPEIDFSRLPIRPAAGHTGREVVVTVPFPGRDIAVQVWVADVGRVPLLLLDTDIPQNDSADRPDHLDALHAGARDAPLPGDRARPRRRAGTRSARHRAARLAHERRALGLPAVRAPLRAGWRPGDDFDGAVGGPARRLGLHHPHAGPGRQRELRRTARAALLRRPGASDSACRSTAGWRSATPTTASRTSPST